MTTRTIRFVVVVGGITALLAIGIAVTLVIRNLKGDLDTLRQTTGAGSGAADGWSLLRARNFEKAIAALRPKAGPGAQVLAVSIDPKTARFQVRPSGAGKVRSWAYTADGDLTTVPTRPPESGRVTRTPIALRGLQAATPEKLVAAVHTRDPRVRLRDVQSITLDPDPASGKLVWSVNIGSGVTGSLYQADVDGNHVRKPGVDVAGRPPGASDPNAVLARANATVARANRLTQCVARAKGDYAKIQACPR